MIRSAAIIPTGDEILSGIVTDTDSPEVMRLLLKDYPECCVTRLCPVKDDESVILDTVCALAGNYDLIILIGGSGGGHRFSDTLGRDFTHSALEELLSEKSTREIYGYNGHLWSKLLCGSYKGSLFINLPGPFVEAQAAMKAFCIAHASDGGNIRMINNAMAEAVIAQYPKKYV